MSHHHKIILQSLQHLSESTHGSSHQIRPLNSVTPPLPPTPTRLPAPLRRFSVPPLTLSSLLPSPAISRPPYLPPHPSAALTCSLPSADSFGFGSPPLLNAVHAKRTHTTAHPPTPSSPQLLRCMFRSRILEAPLLQ